MLCPIVSRTGILIGITTAPAAPKYSGRNGVGEVALTRARNTDFRLSVCTAQGATLILLLRAEYQLSDPC